jgi:hypothetical protein
MTAHSLDRATVRAALEKTGSGWLLSYWGQDAEKNLEKLVTELKGFVQEYRHRFKETPDLIELVEANPVKAAAFFQLDTLLASRGMKVMIWRLLLGSEISELKFRYKAGAAASLLVRLVTPYGEEETYQSKDASDFRILRHVGVTGVGGQSLLQGYYAFRGAN